MRLFANKVVWFLDLRLGFKWGGRFWRCVQTKCRRCDDRLPDQARWMARQEPALLDRAEA